LWDRQPFLYFKGTTIDLLHLGVITNESKSILPCGDVAFGRAFMDMDLDDLDKFDANMHTSL
jgi:hypothetical protein